MKKVQAIVKLPIPAASESSPRWSGLGQHGVNIMEFSRAQARRARRTADPPSVVTIFQDRSFTFI